MINRVRGMLWSIKNRLKVLSLKIAAARPRMASLHFAFLDNGLSREAAAVVSGRLRYISDTRGSGPGYYLLRRNIHRLEKGLIMRPRRSVFAADYIVETIDVYTLAVTNPMAFSIEEHRWAFDVLTEYFKVVDLNHIDIFKQAERFAALPTPLGNNYNAGERIPYARSLETKAPVNFEDFLALSMRRRSVRWYEQRSVPREIVDQALSAAAQAPSACNRQPFVYRIFDDPVRARRLAAIPMGTKGFADQLTGVIVLVGRLRAYPETRDRHAIYVDGALSAMAFMYALETLGVASCSINWPDIEPQESVMNRELSLESDERVIMLIAYGWPDPSGMVPYSAKREHSQLRQFE